MQSDQILKRFFSKSMLQRLILNKHDSFFSATINKYVEHPKGMTYTQLFDCIYLYISHSYRTEYYYKNSLFNKILLKKHNPRTTVAFTELPIARSKADFVMINGIGKVYEIKTELDNLDRLTSQINDYYKAFSQVVVLTHEKNIGKVEKIVPPSVGIMVLTRRGALRTIRKALDDKEFFDRETIFKILRKEEFESIILRSGKSLPECDAFCYYKECFALFSQIDVQTAQKEMLRELKSRISMEKRDVAVKIPETLRFLVYTDRTGERRMPKLKKLLTTVYGG
ncbi:sce7726 family protein [Megasphaera hexanoica]|uniref:Sce7726 family protein n=1 Tax=Megasphaera hexanoica TaxID=1675036 RepID=A0ABW7DJZ2_9FIRM|nr:sce7726 family protein [Megasphaera hexanoica]AXB82369.1 hypothetical protein ACT01_09035 [Megasphaera hexanoica]